MAIVVSAFQEPHSTIFIMVLAKRNGGHLVCVFFIYQTHLRLQKCMFESQIYKAHLFLSTNLITKRSNMHFYNGLASRIFQKSS